MLAVLVFGLSGCGGGGGDSDDGPEVIRVSGLNQAGAIAMPAGIYDLNISGSGHDVSFAAVLAFKSVDMSSTGSIAVISGSVESSLNVWN